MPYKNYWPIGLTQLALFFSIAIIGLFNILFYRYSMPLIILLSGLVIIAFFFIGLPYFIQHWFHSAPKVFYSRLFWYSLLFRLVYIGFISLLTFHYSPQSLPLEMGAADAWVYNAMGKDIASMEPDENLQHLLSSYFRSSADWGFAIFLGLVYSITGPNIILIKIINALLGSLTVVFLSKTATMLYSYKHGKLTGIIAMLMPPLMWFSSKFLKETLMVFITVMIVYFAVRAVQRKKINFLQIGLMVGLTFTLFYFRTVLAVLVILTLGIYLILNFSKKGYVVIILTVVVAFSIFQLIQQTQQVTAVEQQYEELETFGLRNLEDKIKSVGNISVEQATVIPFILIGSIVTPFPSFLNVDERQINVLAHFPNEMIRNLMYYFFFLGIIYLFKKDFRNSSFIISFTIGYVLILAITGTSFFDRFQLPVLPFIIIFIAVGLINAPNRQLRGWKYYLIIMFLAQCAWNLFKLQIRDII